MGLRWSRHGRPVFPGIRIRALLAGPGRPILPVDDADRRPSSDDGPGANAPARGRGSPPCGAVADAVCALADSGRLGGRGGGGFGRGLRTGPGDRRGLAGAVRLARDARRARPPEHARPSGASCARDPRGRVRALPPRCPASCALVHRSPAPDSPRINGGRAGACRGCLCSRAAGSLRRLGAWGGATGETPAAHFKTSATLAFRLAPCASAKAGPTGCSGNRRFRDIERGRRRAGDGAGPGRRACAAQKEDDHGDC